MSPAERSDPYRSARRVRHSCGGIMSNRLPMPGTLAKYLRAYRDPTPEPTDQATAKAIAEFSGCSSEEATQRLGMIFQVRSLIEDYLGREIGDEPGIRLLFGRLSTDFGLSAVEANRLHPFHLGLLLTHLQRWKSWDATERQIILRHIASNRKAEITSPRDPVSSPIFLKALNRFPEPEASEVATSQFPKPEATTPANSEPQANEAPDSSETKKARRKRDEGKAALCVGMYMDAISRSEAPPTASQIAKMVGCNPGTASRAIAQYEVKRKELAREDAKSRYRQAD